MAQRGRIPWARITTESAFIVLSILLAFAIDAWWDGQEEAALESEWLHQLSSEFDQNLRDLEIRIRQNAEGIERFDRFFRAEPHELESLPHDSLRSWLFSFASAWTFDPTRGVSVTLTDPTGLMSVRNSEIRRLVVNWLGLVSDTEEEAASMWAGGTEVIRILARQEFQGTVPEDEPPLIWNSAVTSRPEILADLRRDGPFVSELSVKMHYQDMYLTELEAAKELADSVIAMLTTR